MHHHGLIRPSSYDSDALSFILATNISNNSKRQSINDLVISLKTNDLWEKFLAIYPFVSDGINKQRIEQHKYNLLNPNEHALNIFGDTHSDNGFQTTAGVDPPISYAITNFTDSFTQPEGNINFHISGYASQYATQTAHLTFYNGNPTGATTSGIGLILSYAGSVNVNFDAGGSSGARVTGNGGGFVNKNYYGQRIGNQVKLFRDATKLADSEKTYFGRRNLPFRFEGRFWWKFMTFGIGLTDLEITTLYSIIQNFQIALNRHT